MNGTHCVIRISTMQIRPRIPTRLAADIQTPFLGSAVVFTRNPENSQLSPELLRVHLQSSLATYRLTEKVKVGPPVCQSHLRKSIVPYPSRYNCLSSVLYCIASAICSGKMSLVPLRSAIVLATFSILSYARALNPSFVIACFNKSSPDLSA